MIYNIKLRAALFFCLYTFLFSITCANYSDFRINPDGTPRINISCFELLGFAEITLRHELLYDGDRYLSKIDIPLFSSVLLPASVGAYRWRSVDGRSRELKIGRNWISDLGYVELVGTGGDFFVFEEKAGLFHFYRRGRLAEISSSDATVDFIYDLNSELKNILINGESVVSFARAPGALAMSSDGRVLEVRSENDGSVSAVEIRNAAGVLLNRFKFEYHRGLISKVHRDEESFELIWGNVVRHDYNQSFYPYQPVVVDDGLFHYKFSSFASNTYCRFIANNNEREGEWIFNKRNGTVRIRDF